MTTPDTLAPIPMRLPCPSCSALHIDEGDFATKPHHTHSCQSCGMTWRPAVVATVGVRFLPGFKNKPTRFRIVEEPPAWDRERESYRSREIAQERRDDLNAGRGGAFGAFVGAVPEACTFFVVGDGPTVPVAESGGGEVERLTAAVERLLKERLAASDAANRLFAEKAALFTEIAEWKAACEGFPSASPSALRGAIREYREILAKHEATEKRMGAEAARLCDVVDARDQRIDALTTEAATLRAEADSRRQVHHIALLKIGHTIDCYGPIAPEVDTDPRAWERYADRLASAAASVKYSRDCLTAKVAALEARPVLTAEMMATLGDEPMRDDEKPWSISFCRRFLTRIGGATLATPTPRPHIDDLTDRIRTIADEAFGPFPVQSVEEACSAIEGGIFAMRQESERMRQARPTGAPPTDESLLDCFIAAARKEARRIGAASAGPPMLEHLDRDEAVAYVAGIRAVRAMLATGAGPDPIRAALSSLGIVPTAPTEAIVQAIGDVAADYRTVCADRALMLSRLPGAVELLAAPVASPGAGEASALALTPAQVEEIARMFHDDIHERSGHDHRWASIDEADRKRWVASARDTLGYLGHLAPGGALDVVAVREALCRLPIRGDAHTTADVVDEIRRMGADYLRLRKEETWRALPKLIDALRPAATPPTPVLVGPEATRYDKAAGLTSLHSCRTCDASGWALEGVNVPPGWSLIFGIDGPDAICPRCAVDPEALDCFREEYPNVRLKPWTQPPPTEPGAREGVTLTVGAALGLPQVIDGSHVVEYREDDGGDWEQRRVRRAGADGRRCRRNASEWGAWSCCHLYDDDKKAAARLVPLALADADPSSRGAITGGSL